MELKCNEYNMCYCKRCFLECNNICINELRLKSIQKKLNEYVYLLDEETSMKVYKLKDDFQNKFMSLCKDFHNEYDRIIKPLIEEMIDNLF